MSKFCNGIYTFLIEMVSLFEILLTNYSFRFSSRRTTPQSPSVLRIAQDVSRYRHEVLDVHSLDNAAVERSLVCSANLPSGDSKPGGRHPVLRIMQRCHPWQHKPHASVRCGSQKERHRVACEPLTSCPSERGGFEPPVSFPTHAFQAGTLDHSDTSPSGEVAEWNSVQRSCGEATPLQFRRQRSDDRSQIAETISSWQPGVCRPLSVVCFETPRQIVSPLSH